MCVQISNVKTSSQKSAQKHDINIVSKNFEKVTADEFSDPVYSYPTKIKVKGKLQSPWKNENILGEFLVS